MAQLLVVICCLGFNGPDLCWLLCLVFGIGGGDSNVIFFVLVVGGEVGV